MTQLIENAIARRAKLLQSGRRDTIALRVLEKMEYEIKKLKEEDNGIQKKVWKQGAECEDTSEFTRYVKAAIRRFKYYYYKNYRAILGIFGQAADRKKEAAK